MLLLVIGLVAVIIAVLVTVFLVRRGRADDDEPGGRQAVRDRLRRRGLPPRPGAAREAGRARRRAVRAPCRRAARLRRPGAWLRAGRLRPVPRLRAIAAR